MGPFIPRERAPYTFSIGGWVAHTTGLDAEEYRKSLTLAGKRTPFIQVILRRYPGCYEDRDRVTFARVEQGEKWMQLEP
jgi:hypothetical protein